MQVVEDHHDGLALRGRLQKCRDGVEEAKSGLFGFERGRGIQVSEHEITYPAPLVSDPWDAQALQAYADGVVARLGAEHPGDHVLIVGHENTVPAIVAALARSRKVPLPAGAAQIPPGEFGLLFEVKPGASTPQEFLRKERYFQATAAPGPAMTAPRR